MRRRLATILVAVMTTMALAVSASAEHNVGPCNAVSEPGNSAYAKHHISALATEGGIGGNGHVPGTHRGFSACLGVHGD